MCDSHDLPRFRIKGSPPVNTVEVGLDQFSFYAILVLAFLLCLVYLGVGLRVLREDAVGGKVAQFYGYSVCLVAVIALLVSVGFLAGALLDWRDPLHAVDMVGYPQRSLASFDTYKMDILNPPYGGPQPNPLRYTPDDQTLMRMYEAARPRTNPGLNSAAGKGWNEPIWNLHSVRKAGW